MKLPTASQYTINDSLQEVQCIAPTAAGSRCRLSAGKDKLADANRIKLDISLSTSAEKRLEQAQELVLARCCKRWHREKLRINNELHVEVAEQYLKHLGSQGLLPKLSAPQVTRSSTATQTESIAQASQLSNIIAYSSSLAESIESAMRKDASRTPKTGVVYAFIDPEQPSYVKIGYSTNSAQSRLNYWRHCMPKLKLLVECAVPFPRKIERFIHLELHTQRRRMVQCAVHHTGHAELFEVTPAEAVQVVEDWSTLARREAMYDDGGNVESIWLERLEEVKGKVTARKLLEICDREKLVYSARSPVCNSARTAVLSAGNDHSSKGQQADKPACTPDQTVLKQKIARQYWILAMLRLKESLLASEQKALAAGCSTVILNECTPRTPLLVSG